MNSKSKRYEACTAVATSCHKVGGGWVVDCAITVPSPLQRHAHVLQFSVGRNGGRDQHNIRRLLDM
eukprot:3083471-Rhodomonas_salina.1